MPGDPGVFLFQGCRIDDFVDLDLRHVRRGLQVEDCSACLGRRGLQPAGIAALCDVPCDFVGPHSPRHDLAVENLPEQIQGLGLARGCANCVGAVPLGGLRGQHDRGHHHEPSQAVAGCPGGHLLLGLDAPSAGRVGGDVRPQGRHLQLSHAPRVTTHHRRPPVRVPRHAVLAALSRHPGDEKLVELRQVHGKSARGGRFVRVVRASLHCDRGLRCGDGLCRRLGCHPRLGLGRPRALRRQRCARPGPGLGWRVPERADGRNQVHPAGRPRAAFP
mmetsp:Transcript_41655/g.120271  ORF Transcript_41655/g.120271 Transcript_41655/m.120271 type:complete len:275 (+) Transcript_41655:1184-2008(+)